MIGAMMGKHTYSMKKVISLDKVYGFTAEMLKSSLTEMRKAKRK
jgi:hypothetical protein